MNAIKRAQYLSFLANLEQKITEKNKAEKKRLYVEESWVIKDFCVDSSRQLFHIAQKKEKITNPQGFVYDVFNYIERINTAGGHNCYEKTFQRVKKEVFGISRAYV